MYDWWCQLKKLVPHLCVQWIGVFYDSSMTSPGRRPTSNLFFTSTVVSQWGVCFDRAIRKEIWNMGSVRKTSNSTLIIFKVHARLTLWDMHKKFRRESITKVINYFAETVSKLQFYLQLSRTAFEVSVSIHILMRIYIKSSYNIIMNRWFY